MSMMPSQRKDLLAQWIKPSSDDEKTQQERALHMVTQAINAHDPFSDADTPVYAKGSYFNRTNVRRDSDVDIAVELQDCFYYDYFPGVTPGEPGVTPYSGGWTPATWRAEVVKALQNKFGADSVDTSSNIAINIKPVPGSRPSIDVVPSFNYYRYEDSARSPGNTYNGSCVFPKSGGEKVINWPQQQYDNGLLKNDATNRRYKRAVRALKNAENVLSAAGTIKPLPSYLMECLIYNVKNETFALGEFDEAFGHVLEELWDRLGDDEAKPLQEPNQLKYLFRGSPKWTVVQARELVQATYTHLGYGE